MKESFNDNTTTDTFDPAAAAGQTSTALATREEQTLALPSENFTRTNEFVGEVDPEETLRPSLQIVAKTGKLADEFTPGDLLLNSEYVIGSAGSNRAEGSPIVLVPVWFKKAYQNDLPKNEDEDGDSDYSKNVVDTLIEVKARGGVKGYRPFDDKVSTHFWKPVINAVFLIEMPENIGDDAKMMFPYQVGGKNYVFARYSARNKSAYGNQAKPGIGLALLDAQQKAQTVSGSIRDKVYRLSTKSVSWQPPRGETRSWIEPSLRATGTTSKELKDFIASVEG
jgi:hypothetical protein